MTLEQEIGGFFFLVFVWIIYVLISNEIKVRKERKEHQWYMENKDRINENIKRREAYNKRMGELQAEREFREGR